VNARRSGDLPSLPSEHDLGRLPVLETSDGRPRSEVLGSIGRGEDMSTVEELTAFVVEVIGMVFVREEDCVDGGELGEGESRVHGRLDAEVWGDGEFGMSRAEGWVGEEYDVVDSEEGCGGGDMGDGDLWHGVRRGRVLGWTAAVDGEGVAAVDEVCVKLQVRKWKFSVI
jgi:hypothetical protein